MTLLLIMLLIIVGAGNALAQAIFTVTPSQVPKGAYVNGSGGATDDNYYWQTLYIKFSAANSQATPGLTITLPTGVTVADVNGDSGIRSEIALSWNTNLTGTFAVHTNTTATDKSTIAITIATADIEANDELWVMFPVESSSSPTLTPDDYTINFADTDETDITDGNGPFVTFRGAGDLQIVAMQSNFASDNDTTETYGEKYPTTAAQLFGALPDLVEDKDAAGVDGIIVTLDGTDLNEVTYTLWATTDSTLSHLNEVENGILYSIDFDNGGIYTLNEGDSGGEGDNGRIATGGLPEGNYYFFITSSLTGDFPLARSGQVHVLHYPAVRLVGWDYTGIGGFDNSGTDLDDFNLTVDTGLYKRYNNTFVGTDTRTEADLYVSVDDFDDNARVILFYSTNAGLTAASNLVTHGSMGSVVVDSLRNATRLVDTLYENQEDVDGLIMWNWNLLPAADGSYVNAGTYYIYAVANDGKHQSLLVSKGSDDSDSETITLLHSPKLIIDALTEYNTESRDTNSDANVTIDTASMDVIMLNWAKSGISGDSDIDDEAVIEFYIDQDDGDGLADYASDDGTTLRSDATGGLNGAHRIVTGLLEQPETQSLSYYAWKLSDDTTFTPDDEALVAGFYHLYAIIDENKTDGTVRVVGLGDGGLLQTTDTLTKIEFANGIPFARLFDPPTEGVTINGDETYRMRFNAFDIDDNATVGIFLVSTSATTGDAVSSIAAIVAVAGATNGSAYVLTSDNGTRAAHVTYNWLNEDTATYYDMTIRLPSETDLRYTTPIAGAAIDLAAGTYWVYIGIEDDANNFGTGTELLYRAPGVLTLQNISDTNDPAQRNAMLVPMIFTPSEGDTTTITVRAADEGMNFDIMDFYISVDKTFFDVVSLSSPFTDTVPGAGILIANEAINDTTNNRWILHATAFNNGTEMDIIEDDDLGSGIATFRIVCKGTLNAQEASTAINFVNEPGSGWVTEFSNDGNRIPIDIFNSNISVLPRGYVRGTVELEGRETTDYVVTFELRERGSYVPTSDVTFISANDGKVYTDSTVTLGASEYSPAGVQYKLDGGGNFHLKQIPSGEWDLVIKYNRYLSNLRQISVYPGLDSLTVDFGTLLGGDCYGWTDSLSAVWPNNQIEPNDLSRIKDAYLATPSHIYWNDGTQEYNNYKWADIDESGKVEINDLTMATKNILVGTSGAQPRYKPAVRGETNNAKTMVEFVGLPSELSAGKTYTVQVMLRSAGDVRGYFVNMKYDTDMLAFEGITKGDFLSDNTYSFPVVGTETVGLANAGYGSESFAGDGILAEVTFRAVRSSIFAPSVLGISETAVVDSRMLINNLVVENATGVDEVLPVTFELTQNFPNPFNPMTAISFALPESGEVTLKVYDILGRHVITLVSGYYPAGRFSVAWDATDKGGNKVSAGIYFYRIQASSFQSTKRMLLLK